MVSSLLLDVGGGGRTLAKGLSTLQIIYFYMLESQFQGKWGEKFTKSSRDIRLVSYIQWSQCTNMGCSPVR